jgi:hypothetical protein
MSRSRCAVNSLNANRCRQPVTMPHGRPQSRSPFPGSWRSTFHVEVFGTAMGISFATAKLLDYDDDKLQQSNNPFALITLAHLHSQRMRHDAKAMLAAKWQLTRLLYEHLWSKQRIIALLKVINGMMTLPEPQQARYWHSVIKLEKAMPGKRPRGRLSGRCGRIARAAARATFRAAIADAPQETQQGQHGAAGSLERCHAGSAYPEASVRIGGGERQIEKAAEAAFPMRREEGISP